MLNIQNLLFIPTNYQFFYGDIKKDDIPKSDPKFVKIWGFSLNKDMNPKACYVMDEFGNFHLSKADLVSALDKHCVIRSQGVFHQDKNYVQQLNFQELSFSEEFDFKDLISFD